MKKYLIIGIIGAVAMAVVVKKTNVCSYASTLFAQVERDAKSQVPTKFELERLRNEITNMDSDISQMVRPIAEYKVAIEKMKRDIGKSQEHVAEQKKALLQAVEDLQGSKSEYYYSGKKFTEAQVRRQVERDTETLKRLDKTLKAKQQMLEAKETALQGTQDQLAQLITKKREYEVRLAQLEAENETLQIARIGSDTKFDNTRATQIETDLRNLEDRLKVDSETLAIIRGQLTTVPLADRSTNPADLDAIRSYLQGNAPADSKTASNK